MTTPVFRTIPLTLESLRGPQSKGGPQILVTESPFADIATLERMLRQTAIPGTGEKVEFSLGQSLLTSGVFASDPTNASNFQIPLLHSLAYPADPANPDKLAPSQKPFPVVAILHGQSLSYFFRARTDSTGKVIKRSVKGSKLPRIDFVTLTREINSFLGFKYLQMELAKHGIVSISINSNPANFFDDRALLKFRADLVGAHLDHLESQNRNPKSGFFNKLDFKRVGLMGHSRGGDAVVKAHLDNRSRYGIKAVVSLSPIDQTGLLEPDKRLSLNDWDLHYLVVYGSHDGDVGDWKCGTVDLGTGFRHYDRATCPRAMLFVHGATHNRFNTEWADERRVKSEIDRNKVGINRILTRDEHVELAKEYIGGWFRMALKGEKGLADLFDGRRAVSVSRGPLTVSTQWSFGWSSRVIDDFEGLNASENKLKGKSTATKGAIVKTSIGRLSSSFPHQTKVLTAGKISAASSTFTTEIPNTKSYPGGPPNRDFSIFELMTFRMTKAFSLGESPTAIKSQPFPQFRVRLKDVKGESSTVNSADVYAANAHAPTHPYHRIDWGEPCKEGGLARAPVVMTLNPLETLSVPLALFSKANSKLELNNIRFVEFEFTSVRQDQIFIDDIQLVKR